MAKYIKVEGVGYQNNETSEFFGDPMVEEVLENGKPKKITRYTKAQREYALWLKEGNTPDPVAVDPVAERKAKEYEVMLCRVSWRAAKDEGLAIEAELMQALTEARDALADLGP